MKNLLNKKEIPSSADYTVVALTKESKVIVKGGTPTPPQPTYDYVDLGLSVKWATCNVGATKPEEYGKYFQWGDTVGYTDEADVKAHSTWKTTPFNNGSSSCDSTYFESVSGTVCPNGVLAKEYDAATQNMGDGWRMPTQGEWRELTEKTTTVWTTVNGVQGRKYTSKTDSSKYIFIPAAGGAYGSSMGNVGSSGFVWSSTLDASSTGNACNLYFRSSSQDLRSSGRCDGYSVRGVCK